MSISPFTGVLLPRLDTKPNLDIVPDLMVPIPLPDNSLDPARFCQPLHVYLMHSKGPSHVVILMPAYYRTYSTTRSFIKDRWHAADLDPVPFDDPLILTDRLGTVLNIQNFWEFQRSKDICMAWYGVAAIQRLLELAAKKRNYLSAHFHYLAVTTTVAHFALKDAAAGGENLPYRSSNPWIKRWEALYEREAEGSLGRAWGPQDPRSYLRELVKEDDEGRCDEVTEVLKEMEVEIQEDEELEKNEEYQAIRATILGGHHYSRETYDTNYHDVEIEDVI